MRAAKAQRDSKSLGRADDGVCSHFSGRGEQRHCEQIRRHNRNTTGFFDGGNSRGGVDDSTGGTGILNDRTKSFGQIP